VAEGAAPNGGKGLRLQPGVGEPGQRQGGGEGAAGDTRTIQKVSLSTGRAALSGQLPVSLSHASATVLGGRVFVFGGRTGAGATDRIWRFDPSRNLVSAAGRLPGPVSDAGVASLRTHIQEERFSSVRTFAGWLVKNGPLRDGVISVFCSADLKGLVRRWLDQQPLTAIETYLARACAAPLLEALATSASPLRDPIPAPLAAEGQGGGSPHHCPACSGLPQLSYFAISGETLVSGPRYLLCSRCATSWVFSRMTCAACGEATGARLPIFQEQERFPHIRVDSCQSCHKYLLTFDLRRDTRAVPVVDELAALPLDLYAIDQGLTKITPNLLGN